MRIVLLLLLISFIAPMGFSRLAFADKKGYVPPAWSQKLPADKRFELVLDDQAVLDKETRLVWERSPDTTKRHWWDAISHSYDREVGGRKGWRLPTIEELMSLVDRTQLGLGLIFPAGHPFQNLPPYGVFWSATTRVNDTSHAWGLDMELGILRKWNKIEGYFYVWCVRGGHGYDAY